jgi:hypothetical protein
MEETSILFTLQSKKKTSFNKIKSKIIKNLESLQKQLKNDDKFDELRQIIICELKNKNDIFVTVSENEYSIEIKNLENLENQENLENLEENKKEELNEVKEIEKNKEDEEDEEDELKDIDENNTCLFDFYQE